MLDAIKAVLKAAPRWMVTVTFVALLVFMVASLLLGRTFTIAGYQFGFASAGKESDSTSTVKPPAEPEAKRPSRYRVVGAVKTDGSTNPNEVLISPRYPPLTPSGEGNIVDLEVWKDPDGKFPVLNFSHQNYWPAALDLNDPDRVEVVDDANPRIIIKGGPIQLIRKQR